jgi:membrane protein implicated in regulation of membrane protease activity
MRGPRTQAERDAQTVEIGFALLTGLVLAGLCFLLFTGVMEFMVGLELLSPSVGHTWPMLAGSVSAAVFVGRVLYVLMRSPSGRQSAASGDEAGTGGTADTHAPGDEDGRGSTGAARPQPSQPGRTSPDS